MTLISRYHMFGPQHFANMHVIRAFLDIKKTINIHWLSQNQNSNLIESQKTNFFDD